MSEQQEYRNKKIELANKWTEKVVELAKSHLMDQPAELDVIQLTADVSSYLYDELTEMEEDEDEQEARSVHD